MKRFLEQVDRKTCLRCEEIKIFKKLKTEEARLLRHLLLRAMTHEVTIIIKDNSTGNMLHVCPGAVPFIFYDLEEKPPSSIFGYKPLFAERNPKLKALLQKCLNNNPEINVKVE